jgi:hypothetical protein
MMKCPKCQFEQQASDVCTNCGVIFSKYKKAQESRLEKETRTSRSPSTPKKDNSGDAMFLAMGALFVLVLFARCIFFLQFPPFLDPFFRLLILLTMCWLGYQIVPRAATMLARFEEESDKKWGLDGFNLYDKKTIFLFMALGSFMIFHLAWSVLSGSVECVAPRNSTCHAIYDSVADTGEFWVTVLIVYFISLFTITVGYMGLQLRHNMQ